MNKEPFRASVAKDAKILEIGPSYNPMFPRRDGYKTEIVDHATQDELREKYSYMPGADAIEDVDYICSGSYNSVIPHSNYYDVIYGSHIIEHMVDLIDFFNDVSSLISDDGRIMLVIPDKRYEFDHFREASSLRIVVDNHLYRKNRVSHSKGVALENWFSVIMSKEHDWYIPNSAITNKDDLYFAFCDGRSELSSLQQWKDYDESSYTDMHSWAFTPKSFEILIYELNLAGFIDLKVNRVISEHNDVEFYAELVRKPVEFDDEYLMNLFCERQMEDVVCMLDKVEAEKQAAIQELKQSHSWKVTAPLRAVSEKLHRK